jgi:hypothetical protein
MREEEIIAAGRAMIHELPRLLGDAAAQPVVAKLEQLLARADAGDPNAADDVLDVLTADPVTRQELASRLPDDADIVRGDYPGGLPGIPSGADAVVYRCGTCGYQYPIFEAGEPVPDCPRGHGPLTLEAPQ